MKKKTKCILFVILLLTGGLAYGQTRTVTLIWTPSPSPDVAGYHIFRAEVQGGPYTQINSALIPHTGAAKETWTDPGAPVGKTYYYVATAENTSGLQSIYSNEATWFVVNPENPLPPADFEIEGMGPIAFLSWGNMAGVDKFEIYYQKMKFNKKDDRYLAQGKLTKAGETTGSSFIHRLPAARFYEIRAVYKDVSLSSKTEIYDPAARQNPGQSRNRKQLPENPL